MPDTYSIPAADAQDYAVRLTAELQQLEARHAIVKAILDRLIAQDKPTVAAPASTDTAAPATATTEAATTTPEVAV